MTGLSDLAARLAEGVVGQADAVREVADRVLGREVGGTRLRNQPRGTFLFMGPTGVGKTELAVTLSRVLRPREMSDDQTTLMRVNMADFAAPDSLANWLGDPRSSKQCIWRTSFGPEIRVVLLDEIEKACREVLQLLLAALSCGQVDLASGGLVSLEHAYVIATSNIGAQRIIEMEGRPRDMVRRAVEAELIDHPKVSPEWVGRWGAIVVFRQLDGPSRFEITRRAVEEVLAAPRAAGAKITVLEDTIWFLARRCWSPKYGARSLVSGVDLYVGRALAAAAINGRRDGHLAINAKEDGVELR